MRVGAIAVAGAVLLVTQVASAEWLRNISRERIEIAFPSGKVVVMKPTMPAWVTEAEAASPQVQSLVAAGRIRIGPTESDREFHKEITKNTGGKSVESMDELQQLLR